MRCGVCEVESLNYERVANAHERGKVYRLSHTFEVKNADRLKNIFNELERKVIERTYDKMSKGNEVGQTIIEESND